jgi:hypothetical protein
MDAVVFMDAAQRPGQAPPPPPSGGEKRPRMSANASLIAGVGTLLLAMGIGVLIGHSGNHGSSPTANAAPQIIKVGGGSGETAPVTPKEEGSGEGKKGKAKSGSVKKAEEKSETGASGTSKATEAVLKPKVPQAKPEAQVGEKCEQGTAGCGKSGKFEGNFFGE